MSVFQTTALFLLHAGVRQCGAGADADPRTEMVYATGAHQTNVESPESVEHLCEKCKKYAEDWKPVAEEEWSKEKHTRPAYENYTEEKGRTHLTLRGHLRNWQPLKK